MIIKYSSPNWNDFGHKDIGIVGQTPGCSGDWDKYHFEINNDCEECDYWVIYESTSRKERVKVPPGNVIIITSEEVRQRTYPLRYLKQFDRVVTSRADLEGDNIIKTYYSNAWFVRRTYDQLKAELEIPKTKKISVIASDLVRLEGHKKRFAFVNKLIGHFKDRIDIYGRGFNFVEDKYAALAPYKFSVAIENESIYNYWTEKVVDCMLCHTVPFYFGCPNLDDYLPPESFARIDIEDFKGAINLMEEYMEGGEYDKRLPHVIEAKENILDNLQIFPYITNILKSEQFNTNYSKRQFRTICPSDHVVMMPDLKKKFYRTYRAGKSYLKHKFK